MEKIFSAPVKIFLGPALLFIKWVPGLFPGVKRPGRGVDHPSPSSAEVKERVELCLYSSSGWAFIACCRVNFVYAAGTRDNTQFGLLSALETWK